MKIRVLFVLLVFVLISTISVAFEMSSSSYKIFGELNGGNESSSSSYKAKEIYLGAIGGSESSSYKINYGAGLRKFLNMFIKDVSGNQRSATVKLLNPSDSDAASGVLSNTTGRLFGTFMPGTYDVFIEIAGANVRIKKMNMSSDKNINITFDDNTLSTQFPSMIAVSKKIILNISEQLGYYTINISAPSGLVWRKCLNPPCAANQWSDLEPHTQSGGFVTFNLTWSDPEIIGGTLKNIYMKGYALYSKTGLPMPNANVTAIIKETGSTANTTTDSQGNFEIWLNATLQANKEYNLVIKVFDSQGRESYLIKKFRG